MISATRLKPGTRVVIGLVLIDWKEGGEEKKDLHQMVHVILCIMDPNCNLERIPLRSQI